MTKRKKKRGLAMLTASRFSLGVLLTALLLFAPAGTPHFFRGWLLMAVLYLPMLGVGGVLLRYNPELLEKRLQGKEQDPAQRRVVRLSGLMFIVGFSAAGLDFRYQISRMSMVLSLTAAVVLLISYGMYVEVLRENTYLARTIRVQEGQTVIDTGLYGLVRHPMYCAVLLMFLAVPLVLGSWVSLLIFLLNPVLLVRRIREEERLLVRELPGYDDYRKRVRYRLIPLIW